MSSGWSHGLITGTTKRREQGLADPLLVQVMKDMGMESVPLYDGQSEARKTFNGHIRAMAASRSGLVGPHRREVADAAAMAAEIKEKARSLGADLVGVCAVHPVMVDEGAECPYANVIAIGHHESYQSVLQGPAAVSDEAHRAYWMVAKIATELAIWIREELGWDALAHHNGGTFIQAVPVMWQCGFGELGKHGSLINEKFGASFRPSFVTTDLPMAHDAPVSFGVQDRCTACRVCMNNCPGDAIPDEFFVDMGVKRWLTDVAKCYPYSRLRTEYCHLCVDSCPFNAPNHPVDYRAFMTERKKYGYKTPKTAQSDV